MADVTAAMVKELREETGAGMMDAKRALVDSDGNKEKAKDLLRAKGLSRAAGLTGRATAEGVVDAYVHHAGGIATQAALVELDCETDFAAKSEDFRHLAHSIAMHVLALAPPYIRREDVPADVIEREKDVYRAQVEGKPANIVDKILDGKLNDFYSKVCLLEQPWIKDDKKRISDLVTEAVSKLRENITVARYARFVVGEPTLVVTAGPAPSSQ
jgi:elongation factor Ts